MATEKPADTLQWATTPLFPLVDPGTIVTPGPSTLKLDGWSPGQNPPAQVQNYLQNVQGKWNQFLDERLAGDSVNLIVKAPDNEGGTLTLTSASTSTGTTGGQLRIAAGKGSATGGSILIQPQTPSEVTEATYTGGSVSIRSGVSGTGSGAAGNIAIDAIGTVADLSGNVTISGRETILKSDAFTVLTIFKDTAQVEDAQLVLSRNSSICFQCRAGGTGPIPVGTPLKFESLSGSGLEPSERIAVPLLVGDNINLFVGIAQNLSNTLGDIPPGLFLSVSFFGICVADFGVLNVLNGNFFGLNQDPIQLPQSTKFIQQGLSPVPSTLGVVLGDVGTGLTKKYVILKRTMVS